MRRSVFIFILASIALLHPDKSYAQGYGGPSLLSRGGNQPGQRGRGPIEFNVYASVRATRETGLIAPTVDEAGNITSTNIFGVQTEFGAYGAKSWRRSSVGLDYRGDYRKAFNVPTQRSSYFNGTNQAISLDYTFRATRRFTLFFRETGGTNNRAFGGFAAPAFAGQDNFGVPLNEVFDSRTYFTQTNGGASYRLSARATVTLLGQGFIVKRTNRALIGLQGYGGSAQYDYRLSRSDSVAVTYNYIRFEFPRIYGGSDIHGALLHYTRRINRNWEMIATGGVYNAVTTGTQQVQLSPEIAAILGRSTGAAAFRRSDIAPQAELTFNYTLERSRLTFGYQTGITPGNGVYITSRQDGARAGYSYSGIRRVSLGVSAGYTKFDSLGLQLGGYKTMQGGFGGNYKLAEHWSLSAQADWRKFDAPAVRGRNGSSISLGLSFTPARIPVSIW